MASEGFTGPALWVQSGEQRQEIQLGVESDTMAVDDDGFIYVADVGNRRIRKFAP